MTEKWFSYDGQFSNKLHLQRIAFQKVWCEEMTEKQMMNPTLIGRTAIIGLRNIYDYPDALLQMNDFVQAKITTKYVICIIWKRTYLRTKT